MTPEQLARKRAYAEVELLETVPLGRGQLQRWRPKRYIDASIVSVYVKADGTPLVPAEGPASLTEALRDLSPPLDSPKEFIDVFNTLMGPNRPEVTTLLAEAGVRTNLKLPEPRYTGKEIVFLVDDFSEHQFLRVIVSRDYQVRFEDVQPGEV